MKTLEKSIDTKKAFSKLKDKQIEETLLKVEKAGLEAMERFKVSYKYSDKLCDYYVEGLSENTWPSIILIWTFQSLTWRSLRRRSRQIVSPLRGLEKVWRLLLLMRL